jgi:hypothetical protein
MILNEFICGYHLYGSLFLLMIHLIPPFLITSELELSRAMWHDSLSRPILATLTVFGQCTHNILNPHHLIMFK